MTFDVAGSMYGAFMGRFSEPLALEFVGVADLEAGQRVLDVGCGPGALTAVLVDRLGADLVTGVDPSEPFVEAARTRLPGVDIRLASAEKLPFADASYDAALAQLVVHFMADPVAGLQEMARVTREGGRVAACVWDHAGDRGPLSTFWTAVRDLDPAARDESMLAGSREGHLAELFGAAGLAEVEQSELRVEVEFETFEDWWSPYTLGVGPAGVHVAGLDEPGRDALRARCAEQLPDAPFTMPAIAWCVRARVA